MDREKLREARVIAGWVVREITIEQAAAVITYEYILEAVV